MVGGWESVDGTIEVRVVAGGRVMALRGSRAVRTVSCRYKAVVTFSWSGRRVETLWNAPWSLVLVVNLPRGSLVSVVTLSQFNMAPGEAWLVVVAWLMVDMFHMAMLFPVIMSMWNIIDRLHRFPGYLSSKLVQLDLQRWSCVC